MWLNGIPVTTGPVPVLAGDDKSYSFPTEHQIDENSVIDLVIDNGHSEGNSLSVSSVQAGDVTIRPTDGYLDVGVKAAAFDGEGIVRGSEIVTESGAMRFLVGSATRLPSEQDEKAVSQWCTGKPDQNLDAAKRSFRTECGQAFNDQIGHKCDYKSDGFHCNGMVSGTAEPDKPSDTSGNQAPARAGMVYCYGEYEEQIGIAKNAVAANCGVNYQHMLDEKCVWSSQGWLCGGQVARDKVPVHPFSSLCERYDTFLEVRAPKDLVVSRMQGNRMLVQWKAQDCENRNFHIWQNGVKIASSHPYNYIIRNVPYNQTIEIKVSTWEYLHRRYYTHESPASEPVAFKVTDDLKDCKKLGNSQRYRCSSISGNLKGTTKGETMVVVPTDLGGTVLYAGPLDSGGFCTLHVPAGADESATSGLVGWAIDAANDACNKDGKSCGGGDGGDGGDPPKPPKPDPKPDFVCGKGASGKLEKCI